MAKERGRLFSVVPLEMKLPGLNSRSKLSDKWARYCSSLDTFETSAHWDYLGLKATMDAATSPRVIGTHLPYNFLPPAAKRHEVKVRLIYLLTYGPH